MNEKLSVQSKSSKEILDQLQEILRDDFGMECSRDEANAIARELIGFLNF